MSAMTLDTSTWHDFKVRELFDVLPTRKVFHANKIRLHEKPETGTYPYVVRASTNNGVRGYAKADARDVNPGNVLSFAQDTFLAFYQERPFITGNNVKVLAPHACRFNARVANFVIASFNKTLEHLSWGIGSTAESIGTFKIKLPAKRAYAPDWNALAEIVNGGGVLR